MGQRLLAQAEHDLDAARRILVDIGAYDIAANAAFDAADKAIKAAYLHVRAESPFWGHDLRAYLDGIEERIAPEAIPNAVRTSVADLVALHGTTRYPTDRLDVPIPAELITRVDAERATLGAEAIVTWSRTQLQRPPGQPGRTRRS